MKQNEKLYNSNTKSLYQLMKETLLDKNICRPYVSRFKLYQNSYVADAKAKTIKLSEIETPNEKFGFQDNLRRFFLTTDDDMLLVRTGNGDIEYVDVKKLRSIDDIFRILKLGYQTPNLEGTKTNTVLMRTCLLFSTIHLKSNWLERVQDNVINHHGVYLKNPSTTYPYYHPKDNEVTIFDMEDEFTKKYMDDKYCQFDVTGHFERVYIHKILGNHSGYVLNKGTKVLDWSEERAKIYMNFFNTYEDGKIYYDAIDSETGEKTIKSVHEDDIKEFNKGIKDYSLKDLK